MWPSTGATIPPIYVNFWHICPSVGNKRQLESGQKGTSEDEETKILAFSLLSSARFMGIEPIGWEKERRRTRSSKNNGRRIYSFFFLLLPSAFISFFDFFLFFLHCAYIKKMHVRHCPSINERVRSSKFDQKKKKKKEREHTTDKVIAFACVFLFSFFYRKPKIFFERHG